MAKAVVYALLAAAFLVLLLSGPSNRRHHNHPRLNRRLGDKFHATTFDPLVAKIERYAEEKGLKIEDDVDSTINTIRNDSFFGEVVNDEKEYFSNEGRLNITSRLVILFPLLDKAPRDGAISPLELNSWLTDMAVERLNYRTQKELASHDSNGDKAISFREYLSQFSDEDIEKNGLGHGEAGWWKQQFDNADFDRNGTLSFDEFKDFLHPEDSDNKEIKKWLLKEKLERMDYDKDGRLSFVEFCDHTYDIYKNYVEYETAPGRRVPKPEEKFAELDLDKDRYLTVEELIPILGYLHPGELSYAKYYSSYLIHEADDNKDGKLTLDEMLNHEYVFYSTVYDDSHEDYEEDSRDEL